MADLPQRIWVDEDTWFDRPAYSRAVEYVRADAIASLPAQGVRVKPLVWTAREDLNGLHEACGADGLYRNVWDQKNGTWVYEGDPTTTPPTQARFPTLDAAKAAAQADYERRILAALEPAEAGGVDLSSPVAVHLNMLRGTIAKPTVEQIIHLYGFDALLTALRPQIMAECGTPLDQVVTAEAGGVEAPAEDATAKGETPGEMLDRLGMDGVKWAAEFRTTALRLGYSDMDEGWLIGWFCNAIMAGYDRAPAPAPDAVEALVKADYATARRDAARLLWDMLYMQNGAADGMTREEVQAIWGAAKDQTGYAAVNAFLAAIREGRDG